MFWGASLNSRQERDNDMDLTEYTLFSGGARGAESVFGTQAEHAGIKEINFTFEGHQVTRHRGLHTLTPEELSRGDVSLEYVTKLMNRRYTDSPTIRLILQTIWHQIISGQEIFVVGEILDDLTVKGGTGWGAEFAKLCNKPLYVFDQKSMIWHKWNRMHWDQLSGADQPRITDAHFTGTGTRFLTKEGTEAIELLFDRSFA